MTDRIPITARHLCNGDRIVAGEPIGTVFKMLGASPVAGIVALIDTGGALLALATFGTNEELEVERTTFTD